MFLKSPRTHQTENTRCDKRSNVLAGRQGPGRRHIHVTCLCATSMTIVSCTFACPWEGVHTYAHWPMAHPEGPSEYISRGTPCAPASKRNGDIWLQDLELLIRDFSPLTVHSPPSPTTSSQLSHSTSQRPLSRHSLCSLSPRSMHQ